MPLYAVTVKLAKNPAHDPKNKQTGRCPVNGRPCDDVTGEHHTFTASGSSIGDVREFYSEHAHVTRVEEIL